MKKKNMFLCFVFLILLVGCSDEKSVDETLPSNVPPVPTHVEIPQGATVPSH